ncbi:MAG: hypothetical protein IKQ69_06805 [Oscillospiraceae bacterium]|nr:hypothetical protein [Oscillospiraceae bacterium]MBR6208691.1 hypothetical protein [Oscillospiraceae bacterium]
MENVTNLLLEGAIDLHAHAYPEYTTAIFPRLSNYEWAKMAVQYKMRGFVMKSHIWCTAMQAFDLMQIPEIKESGLEIFGSITLNHTSGGLNPLSVAIAGEMGAKAVFMPTWGSTNDVEHFGLTAQKLAKAWPGFRNYLKQTGNGITILDNNGKIKAEVHEILEVAKKYNMYVESAHMFIEESTKLAEAAALHGVRFSLTHPFNTTIAATVEQQKYIADTGAYIEQCFITCMPMHMRVNIHNIADAIEKIGVERTIFATDAIGEWNPPEPELMRMSIGSLLRLGFSPEEVKTMTARNPAVMLDIPVK